MNFRHILSNMFFWHYNLIELQKFLSITLIWHYTLNPILYRGGQICPGHHKPVCHFHANCARVTKIHDFVPFYVRPVLEKLFFKFSNFCWKYQRSPKISKGGTLLCKNWRFQRNFFFLEKSYFFYLKMNYTWTELSFEVHNSLVAQNFTFSSFFAWKVQSLIYHVSMAQASKVHYLGDYVWCLCIAKELIIHLEAILFAFEGNFGSF